MKGDKDGKPILSYDKIHDIPNHLKLYKEEPFLVLNKGIPSGNSKCILLFMSRSGMIFKDLYLLDFVILL